MRNLIIMITILISFATFAKTDFKKVTTKGITLEVPSDWTRTPSKDQWLEPVTRNNLNYISESSAALSFDAYIKLSKTNMKKAIPSYVVISEKRTKIDGKPAIILLGTFEMYNNKLKMYSVIVDEGATKSVITIGGTLANFDKANSNFIHIINSYKKDPNFVMPAKSIPSTKAGVKSYKRVSLWIPAGWTDKEKMWVDTVTYSSANISLESQPTLSLSEYMSQAKVTMKKMIPSYTVLSESKKTLNGREAAILLGEFTQSGMKLKIYSVVIDLDGMKYVLTVGGPEKTFDKMNPTFQKIINSYTGK